MNKNQADRALIERVGEALLHERKLRQAIVPMDLLGEPAWEIVLSLLTKRAGTYCCDAVIMARITRLSEASVVRWLAILAASGVLEEVVGKERPTYRLSNSCELALQSYLRSLPHYAVIQAETKGDPPPLLPQRAA